MQRVGIRVNLTSHVHDKGRYICILGFVPLDAVCKSDFKWRCYTFQYNWSFLLVRYIGDYYLQHTYTQTYHLILTVTELNAPATSFDVFNYKLDKLSLKTSII